MGRIRKEEENLEDEKESNGGRENGRRKKVKVDRWLNKRSEEEK